MNFTVNKIRKVVYVASGFTTGLTDLVLSVRKPDGTLVTPIVTEQGDGVYVSSYTPDVSGIWQERITSVVNRDKIFRSIVIDAIDEDDIKSTVDSVNTKVDTITNKIDAVKTDVDSVGTAVVMVSGKTDAIKTELDAVKVAVDNMNFEITTGGYFA
jgi:hypothetical protein